MGGVAGHLAHLYDNRDLTYNEMADILQKAAGGELKGTEKTDGYNIYVGYRDGTARAARNKGDMSRGGMTFDDLINRVFRGGEEAKTAYVTAFNAYEKALDSLSDEERSFIFGPNEDIFYNAEIQGPVASNVVNYDENILNIHRMGHKRYNPETNQLEIVDTTKQSKYLDKIIDRFEDAAADEPFSVRRTAFLQLNKITDERIVENALERIQSTGFTGDMTINDYLEYNFNDIINNRFPNLEESRKQALIRRMLGEKGAPSITQVAKGLPAEDKKKLSEFRWDSKFIVKKLMAPIEESIHDFAVELLRGLESAYILDNKKEVERLKEETKEAILAINNYEGPEKEVVQDILAKQLEKLKHHDNIDTVVEGFAFQHNGQMYKFTGNFAPINQLLGLFRYGRGSAPPMVKESILEQKEFTNDKKIIAIYPGRYQPMGQHHAEVFSSLLDSPEFDEVFLATSNKVDMSDKDGTPKSPFDFSEKQAIANFYGIDPMKVIMTSNPYYAREITDNFDPEEYQVVYFVGDKDMKENPRFERTQGVTKEGFDWRVVVAPHVAIHIPEVGEMSGTNLRKALKDADEGQFEKIMGNYDPEIFKMIKDKLAASELKEAQYHLGIFCGLIEQAILESNNDGTMFGVGRGLAGSRGYWKVAPDEPYRKDLTKEEIEELEEDELEEITVAAAVGGYSLPLGAKPKKVNKEKKELEEMTNKLTNYLLNIHGESIMSEITPLQEKKLRTLIRKGYVLMIENEKKQQKDELRFRRVIQHLLKEAEAEQVITSTGISILGRVLDAIYEVSKDGYKFLKTSPDQRKAFLQTWEWLFKESFFGDVKTRNAIERAAKQIGSKGFDTKEAEELPEELNELLLSEQEDDDDEKIIMKVTDPDLVQEPVEKEKSEEEVATDEEDEFVKDIASAPVDADKTGPSEAVRIFNQTKNQIFNAFDELNGDDAEKFYKWFFINMLGSGNSGFGEEAGENVVGHFQRAELELKEQGIESAEDLLPSENPESYNLQDTDF